MIGFETCPGLEILLEIEELFSDANFQKITLRFIELRDNKFYKVYQSQTAPQTNSRLERFLLCLKEKRFTTFLNVVPLLTDNGDSA